MGALFSIEDSFLVLLEDEQTDKQTDKQTDRRNRKPYHATATLHVVQYENVI